jgi:hypothetical protein
MTCRIVSLSSRLAPMIAIAASGSSMSRADSRLTMKPLVRTSSVTSNQASAVSSVARTMRHMISSCLPRQAAQAVTANVQNSATSNPTHAPRQLPVR